MLRQNFIQTIKVLQSAVQTAQIVIFPDFCISDRSIIAEDIRDGLYVLGQEFRIFRTGPCAFLKDFCHDLLKVRKIPYRAGDCFFLYRLVQHGIKLLISPDGLHVTDHNRREALIFTVFVDGTHKLAPIQLGTVQIVEDQYNSLFCFFSWKSSTTGSSGTYSSGSTPTKAEAIPP